MTELTELVRQIRNRCDIYLILQQANAQHLQATLLEDLYTDAQTIMDEYCIERQDD